MQRYRTLPLLLMAIAACLYLSACAPSEGATTEQAARPDLITFDGFALLGRLERPPAQFPHDLHTEALKQQNSDCTICHPQQEDGSISALFKRLEATGRDELIDLYHDECIGCHKENAALDLETGPVTCGECHRDTSPYNSSRQLFGFDKSLHYRHLKAHENKCEACHHVYKEETKQLVYVKGQESSCRDCHRQQTEENRSAFRLAAHAACVGCHRKTTLADAAAASGPQTCTGCHDQAAQQAIEIVEDPPRLEREQPDFVLLSAPEAELEFSKLNTVPFSHIAHEGFSTDCRGCHHESLARCSECHTLAGDEKGAGVMLQHAMHRLTSSHSCVGCHQTQKTVTECAGCHDLMEQGRLSEHSCNICHAGPEPEKLASERELYASLDDFRPRPAATALSYTEDEVPEDVSIGRLAKEYQPVTMPHRKIVNKLSQHIKDNKLATHFHGHEDVVCQGCHHHGSIGKKPALCENCHGKPFNESDLHKPGLNGTYHRQCLGCHLSMGLQESSDCKFCHKQTEDTLENATDSKIQ